jgi:hypothetical protein
MSADLTLYLSCHRRYYRHCTAWLACLTSMLTTADDKSCDASRHRDQRGERDDGKVLGSVEN